MSSSEGENFDLDVSGSESDDYAPAPKKAAAKKVAPKTVKAKTTTAKATTSKAASKPKASASKKKVLATHNSSDTDPMDVDGPEDEDESDFGKPPAKKGSTSAAGGKQKTASEKYQKLTQIEHVLKRPDTYIGSVESVTDKLWTYDAENKRMINRNVTYVPGFYKIVDEILVNAADNKVNDPSMDTIKVNVDVEEGTISIYNNGRGIPIEIHSKEGVYIPELIFGHLLSGSNYDDDEKRLTGGRNGYGAKLANIYSHEFTVETAHKETQQKYKQTWTDNMGKCGKAKITKNARGEEWTRITFRPDLARFGMNSIDEDTASLIRKRAFDMAGTVKNVKVFLNDERLKVRNFKQYVEMHLNSAAAAAAENSGGAAQIKPSIIHEVIDDRWEVAFAVSDGTFEHVSFANSIATTKGGTHVNLMADQISKSLISMIEKKNRGAKVKPAQIRSHMWIFVNALIENPTFDNQTKETLTLTTSKFGRKPLLSEDFHKKVQKSAIIERVLSWAKFKADQEIKRTDGSKRTRLTGIAKLSDANNAGTKHAKDCTLILTEGDSAKALAIAGLGVVGRDNFGVFPLRGKLLNVREAKHDQVIKNEEIQNIKKIMGLQHNKDYTSVSSLRYGQIMIMTDQDHDGSHIKGLLINFLDHYYPSLLKLPEFLVEFVTPIVRVTKNKNFKNFFTIPEYQQWVEQTADAHRWQPKYYKGLGTSKDEDARQYFSAMGKHMIPFAPTVDGDKEAIELAFSKKKADERKEWLRQFKPGTYLDHRLDEIPYTEFIHKELILFSMADNIRSIPAVADGLKPGQRKIIWGCFKRKMKKEIKVAQLVGYISEKAAYHHGEVSLMQTIIGLAQNFVGSNNINLLLPNGQYGTRDQGGKDHAAARYIFTELSPLTRLLFNSADDSLLKEQIEENDVIEPECYMPILPTVLVNGADGIGTGWSTNIPCYNPIDIVANIRRLMNNEEMVAMSPWWRGFNGEIKSTSKHKYEITGVVRKLNDTSVEITELPIHKWTQNFKTELEAMVVGGEKTEASIKDYKEYHDNRNVHFVIQMDAKKLEKAEAQGLVEFFKLTSKLSTSNMICFDIEGKIKRYDSPEEIIEDFYPARLAFYQRRKDFMVGELQDALDKLNNQARFIQMIVDKELTVSNRKKADIVADLRKHKFKPFKKVAKAKAAGETEEAADDPDRNEDEDDEDMEKAGLNDFDYLLGMHIYSLTRERIEKLKQQSLDKEAELVVMLKRSPKDLWNDDLDEFVAAYEASLKEWTDAADKDNTGKKVKRKQTKLKTRKSVGERGGDDDDSEDDFRPTKAAPKKKAVAPTTKSLAASRKAKAEDEDSDRPRARAKPKPKQVVKEESSDESDVEVIRKAPPRKAPTKSMDVDSDEEPASKASKASSSDKSSGKRKSLDTNDDGSDVPLPKPLKKAKASESQSNVTDFFSKSSSSGVGSSKPTAGGARKVSKSMAKKSPPKKPAKKVIEDSESENDMDFDELPKPPPRAVAPRTARAASKTAKYVEIVSDDEDDGAKDESMFVDDDD